MPPSCTLETSYFNPLTARFEHLLIGRARHFFIYFSSVANVRDFKISSPLKEINISLFQPLPNYDRMLLSPRFAMYLVISGFDYTLTRGSIPRCSFIVHLRRSSLANQMLQIWFSFRRSLFSSCSKNLFFFCLELTFWLWSKTIVFFLRGFVFRNIILRNTLSPWESNILIFNRNNFFSNFRQNLGTVL